MPADYHIHTVLCRHAEGDILEYVEAAHRAGLNEIGFADHSPMASYFDDWRMGFEQITTYFDMVDRARERGRELGVKVKLGLEIDYLEGSEDWITTLTRLSKWDYLIGSVHYLWKGIVVDHPEHISKLQSLNPDLLWKRYWDLSAKAIQSGLFDFIAHPDLPKKFGIKPMADPTENMERIVNLAKTAGVAFEINTSGLYKPVGEMYPSLDFLQIAAKAGVNLVISSDAHHPDHVGRDFDRAVALAREAGFTKTVRYTKRKTRYEPLPKLPKQA